MTSNFQIIGVYPIKANEPCHLIEVMIHEYNDNFDWGSVTQEIPGVSRDNWQAVYDEQLIDQNDRAAHFAFFFHYLDFSKPLLTPSGQVVLPKPKWWMPFRLKKIKYYPVD